MGKHLCAIILLVCLSACVAPIWTGWNLVYDRHQLYTKINDLRLSSAVSKRLSRNLALSAPGVVLDTSVFHGDILVAGHVPTQALRQWVQQALRDVRGYRRLFIQIAVAAHAPDHSTEDAWLTTKIRSLVFADSSINPRPFKIVTVDDIVYIMGDMPDDEAHQVVSLTAKCEGVKRVVTLFKT